jgi:hypothetical protein
MDRSTLPQAKGTQAVYIWIVILGLAQDTKPKPLKMMMMMIMMSVHQQILPLQAKECSMYKTNHTLIVHYCVTILMLWVAILHAFTFNLE